MMALQAKLGGKSVVLDVKGAYLLTKVPEEHPNLYLQLHDRSIVRLNKFLYGLKQAGYEWQQNVSTFLMREGYTRCISSDPCAFVKRIGNDFIMMCLHVDDFYVVTNSDGLLNKLIQSITTEYGIPAIKDSDELGYLGMKIAVSESFVKVSQPGYTLKLLHQHLEGFEEGDYTGRLYTTPLDSIPKERDKNDHLIDTQSYLRVVGGLNYLAQFTRPDILFATSIVAQQCSAPTSYDWNNCQRILKFLACTLDLGLTFHKGPIELECFADASHLSYSDSKGHGGHCFRLGAKDGAFFATSKKLKLVTLSSTETEFVELCEASRNVIWLRKLL